MCHHSSCSPLLFSLLVYNMSRGHPQQPHAPSCLCSSCHLSSKLFPRGPNDRIILPAIRPTPTSPLASPTDFIRRFDPVNGAFKGLPDGRQKLMTESSVELRAKDQLVQELLDRWAPMNVANPDHDISSSLALSKTPSVRWRELGRSELLTGLRMKHVKASSSDFKDNAQLNKGKLANSPLLQSSSDDERSAFEEALDAAFFPEEKISGTIGPRSSPKPVLVHFRCCLPSQFTVVARNTL
ncbi:hypothetical protein C8J57DRAFT_153994 [Mycena rebaudengoi]|nr:hypothetical protein C8J57DRAFT_153994 [Mycena rebaudengoi]